MKRRSWLLVSIAGFFAFTMLGHQAEPGDFKIYTGSPGYKNFDQIDSCDFDGIGGIDFDTADFNANTMGLDMFARLGGWDMEGKNSKYAKWLTGADFFLEAEARDLFGRQMLGFNWFVNNCVGEDKNDPAASNGWARWAAEGVHNSGNVIAELRNELDSSYFDPDTMSQALWWLAYRASSWFSTQIWIDSTTKRAEYYAFFRIKVNADAQDIQLRLSVATIRGNYRDILKADTLDAVELSKGSYDSYLVQFHKQYDTTNSDPNQYDTTQYLITATVWWNGEDTVWIDGVEIIDEWAWNTLHGEYDDSVTAFLNQDDYVDQPIIGFGLDDEPEPYRINVNKYWANFIKNHPHTPPYTAHTSWAKAFNFYLDYWFQDTCAVEEHLVNMYAMNGVRTDTSSETCNPPNTTQTLQEAIDALLSYLDIQRVRAHQEEKKLAYNVGAAQAYDGSPTPVLRRPTQWEQEAAPWLAISHGVDVISYWEYTSYYKVWNDSASPDTTAPWYFWWTFPDPDRILVAWVRGLVYADTETGPLRPEKRETHHVEPQWSVVRRVNKQLHAIGDVLADPDSWIAGFTCDEVPQSWVSSFKSDSYTNDKAYVEIATFEHNNIDYLLLLNRRCLSTEGQNVTVELDLSGDQYYIVGLEYIESGDCAAFTDTTYSAKLNGKIPFSTYLAPGQGKFFKIIAAQRKS